LDWHVAMLNQMNIRTRWRSHQRVGRACSCALWSLKLPRRGNGDWVTAALWRKDRQNRTSPSLSSCVRWGCRASADRHWTRPGLWSIRVQKLSLCSSPSARVGRGESVQRCRLRAASTVAGCCRPVRPLLRLLRRRRLDRRNRKAKKDCPAHVRPKRSWTGLQSGPWNSLAFSFSKRMKKKWTQKKTFFPFLFSFFFRFHYRLR